MVTGLVPGVERLRLADDRLTSRLGAALFSIPPSRASSSVTGFEAARRVGLRCTTPSRWTSRSAFVRTSNNAGGLEGGNDHGHAPSSSAP